MTESIILAFIYLRRSIRQRQAILDQATDTRNALLRQARKLDGGTPFDRARAATCRARHAAMDPLWHSELDHRRELGRELLTMAPQFDAATTLQQRLELLNVNVADRADIRPGDGLLLIVAGHCLEDSAAHRSEECRNGPLFNSVQLEIIITMAASAEGRAATDKVMVDVFGAQGYHLFGQQPTLQLVGGTAATPPGALQ